MYFTGDVMYDVFLKMKPYFNLDAYRKYGLKPENYIVVTIHRDFNTDDPEKLKAILQNLEEIAKEIDVIFPIHPRTRKRIKEHGFEKLINRIRLIEPVDYLEMMGLVMASKAVITDSGDLQKEAYFCGKRAVVVMPDTGWRELVKAGWNILSTPENTKENLEKILEKSSREIGNLYGNGNAAEKIVDILTRRFER